MAVKIFFCYAQKDQSLLNELKAHLMSLQRQELITLWADTDINAGVERESEIHKHLDSANIILLLVSPDFMASDYCYSNQMKRAMERHKQGRAYVIPILLRPTFWKGTPFSKLQALPKDALPVTSWPNQDLAFYNVADSILKVVAEVLWWSHLSRQFRVENKIKLICPSYILFSFQRYFSGFPASEGLCLLKND